MTLNEARMLSDAELNIALEAADYEVFFSQGTPEHPRARYQWALLYREHSRRIFQKDEDFRRALDTSLIEAYNPSLNWVRG